MKASSFSMCNNSGLLTPESNPTEFKYFVHSRSHAAAASRVRYMARCNRQTIPGGSFASGGGSTYNSRNTSLHRCAFSTSMKLSFNGRLFRDTLLVMASEISNLTASRSGVDAKKFALTSSVFVSFLHLFRHQPATNFWRPLIPFICVDPPRLDHSVRTTFRSWDATVHISGSRKPPVSSST